MPWQSVGKSCRFGYPLLVFLAMQSVADHQACCCAVTVCLPVRESKLCL